MKSQKLSETTILCAIIFIIIVIAIISILIVVFLKKESNSNYLNQQNIANANTNSTGNAIDQLNQNTSSNTNSTQNISNPYAYEQAKIEDSVFYGYCLKSALITDLPSNTIILNTYSKTMDFYNKYKQDGYENYLSPLMSKYNDEFFETKSLAIVYVELDSGDYMLKFISAKKVNNSVYIQYSINNEGLTDDMGGNLVVVEVTKDIENIIYSSIKPYSTEINTYIGITTTNTSDFNGYSLNTGYFGELPNNKMIFNTYSELRDFYNNCSSNGYESNLSALITKYNENFFSSRSLAIEYVVFSDSGTYIDSLVAKKQGKSVKIEYKMKKYGGVSLAVLEGNLIVIEVTKDITNIR